MTEIINFFTDTTMMEMFYYIGVPATISFLIIMGGAFIGFGDDMDTDMDMDGDIDLDDAVEGTFPIFTLRNFFTFFTMFAWVGVACLEGGVSNPTTLLISTLSGLGLVIILSFIFFSMDKLKEDNTRKLSDAVGETATVYFTIPEKDGGMGKVQVTLGGALQTIDAISNGKEIKTGRPVKVVGSTGAGLIVESLI